MTKYTYSANIDELTHNSMVQGLCWKVT